MTYRKWQTVSRILSNTGTVVCVLGCIMRNFLLYIGIAALVASFLVSVIYLKCPKCGRAVPETMFTKVSRCPYCGKEIE